MSQLVAFYTDLALPRAETTGVSQLEIADSEKYRFPLGSATPRVVYVRHPKDPQLLIPFAAFDAYVLQDKYNEALRIVTELGASEVICRSLRGESVEAEAGIGIKGLSLSGGAKQSSGTDISYEQRGQGGPPRDPGPLRWPDEPAFEAARAAVLWNGATEVMITVRSGSQFHADSGLGNSLSKAGFHLGFSMQKNEATVFALTAKFAQNEKANKAKKLSPQEWQAAPPAVVEQAPQPERKRRWFG